MKTAPSVQLFRSLNQSITGILIAALTAVSAGAATLSVPAPQDLPYPGTIALQLDVTNLAQRIFQVHEHIPVNQPLAGHQLTLLYPQWIPGNHSPTGPISLLAGLQFNAAGKRLVWHRDPLDMYAFHIDVPDDATSVDVDYQFLTPLNQSAGRIVATRTMVGVQWNTVILYPAGHFARDITFQPAVVLPAGWQYGSALTLQEQRGNQFVFAPVALDELADSPLMAGSHFRRVDLDPGAPVPVHLDVFADEEKDLETTPQQLAIHRALVQQAYKLYGSHHYDHYDFLFALSDEFSEIGLEHHQSSEDAVKSGYFSDWANSAPQRDLLAHEYTHSWNGKFRRPADLWTPNYNVPMQNSLLWVYEGQTEYWGFVLAARSGLLSTANVMDFIAMIAAGYDQAAGRTWRPLQDTTNQPILNYHQAGAWPSWQRDTDYYDEGLLIWLDVDSKIRELSGDRRALNDFAQRFFSMDNGRHVPLTYQFDDVVSTLNAVQPYDWAAFLRARLDSTSAHAPLDGLTRSGWRLDYTDQPSDYLKASEQLYEFNDFTWSLGIGLDKDAHLASVIWGSPAFNALLSPGMQLIAVDGRSYKAERLKAAIVAARTSKEPITLMLKSGERFLTVKLDYHDGLRYPHLVRVDGSKDRLTEILQPLK